MSGHKKDTRRVKRKKPLSHGWIVVPSKSYRDRVYFFNVITKCSSWINPCEVIDDDISSEGSSEISMKSKNLKHTNNTSLPQKRSETENFPNPMNENSDIEDYDEEHDRYFDSVNVNNFNMSHPSVNSPRSSTNSTYSQESYKSDSDTSKSHMIFENDKKELWLHFASGPRKKNTKKSVALSDFEQPFTSEQSMGVENGKQLPQTVLHNDNFKEPEINEKNTKRKRKNQKKKWSNKTESGKCETKDRQSNEKVTKCTAFKVKDKTAAQSRMLQFRREYANKIKKVMADSMPVRNLPHKNKNFNVSSSSSAVGCLDNTSYGDNSRQGVEFKSIFQQNEEVLENDGSEEMDWEPSSEESDVRNINEFRQQQDKNQPSNSIFYELSRDHKTTFLSQTQEVVLVLDTNIFVSCLNFVKELRDTNVRDLGYAIIYVPWRVLQELDHLKDSKIDGTNKQLSLNVRKAISFLNENFKFKHPRIFGQSFEDFNKMMDFDNFAPDDEILQTCIQLKKRHLNITLMLLTNDKNLESKANVSGVNVYSKESFQKKYMNSKSYHSVCSNSSNVTTTSQGHVLKLVLQIDNYVCEIKALLKEFLSIVVETEMRVAFEGDWIKVIHKKPPWTTNDVLDCFLKHWRSVFFLVFSKVTLIEAENLNKKLFIKEPASVEDVLEIILIFQRFVKSIISSQKKRRPYLDLTDSLMNKLSCLLKDKSLNSGPQVDSRMSQLQYSLLSTPNESSNQPQPSMNDITPLDISNVQNLFRNIWESLRCFCCSMSDVMNSPNPSSNTPLHELRLKQIQVLNEVGELIASLEKIFEINLPEINECHPLIIHLSQFLSTLHPTINIDLQNKFPRCLAAIFTDFEGRTLFNRALTDFREFYQELTKTSQFFRAIVHE